MDHQSSSGLQQFKNSVGIKFQLYNSLFTSLPFHRIEKTGILLSLLLNNCEEGFRKKQSPEQIIGEFFQKHTSYTAEADKLDLLFRFIQFVERQVVLFDALEDAAFCEVNDMNGVGTLKQLELEVIQQSKQEELYEKLKKFGVRLVLTAHPTQFYPGSVLGIINDLSEALKENNATKINTYLQQLGKTPFFNKEKPTPYDEAISLCWYLENVFYPAAGKILSFIKSQFPQAKTEENPIINMGFWPGGDRDGNPNVSVNTTLKVADALRSGIIECYYGDIRKLKRRLTFKGVDAILNDLEKQLYNNIFIPGQKTDITKQGILDSLLRIREILIYQHNGLFQHLVDNLISKVHVFGLHFASLDIRQDSSIHRLAMEAIAAKGDALPRNYGSLSDEEKIKLLVNAEADLSEDDYENPLIKDTIQSIKAIRQIQQYNGVEGCNRYIISHSNSALDVLQVYGLFLLCGWKKNEVRIDIVPLFETVEDLRMSGAVMQELYSNKEYMRHLKSRKSRQTIMLGFSDGTKDGGYFMANWSIYKAKEDLTNISRQFGIEVVFFDGRGGPPSRGGGKTHKFYASMGKNISNEEIQLTIQGQTVSSNFGTIDSAQYNIEQLIHAGISNTLFSSRSETLKKDEEAILQELADESFKSYILLKQHPDFVNYLAHVSPLKFYGETNIGSRPSKRGVSSKFSLDDLRAIPYVGAWSQLKQNVTGYYGVGSALRQMEKNGKWAAVKQIYERSLFFKTMMDNCEMVMKKCFFPLTEYLANHPRYGQLFNMIYEEYELTQHYLFLLSGKNELMADYPVEQQSIQMREKIVLPITTIQQYALSRIRDIEEQGISSEYKETYEKLVIRSSFGIINAGRNSV